MMLRRVSSLAAGWHFLMASVASSATKHSLGGGNWILAVVIRGGGVHSKGRIRTVQLHPGSSTQRDFGGSQRGKSPVEDRLDTFGGQGEWVRTLVGLRAENINEHKFWNIFVGAEVQNRCKSALRGIVTPVLLRISCSLTAFSDWADQSSAFPPVLCKLLVIPSECFWGTFWKGLCRAMQGKVGRGTSIQQWRNHLQDSWVLQLQGGQHLKTKGGFLRFLLLFLRIEEML